MRNQTIPKLEFMVTLQLSSLIISVKVELVLVLMLIKPFVDLIPRLNSIEFAVLERIMVNLFCVVLLKLRH